MKYLLPWEVPHDCQALRPEIAIQITKDVYALAADDASLLADKRDHQYEFEFDMDSYIVLAQIMIKFDRNLQKTRQQCVPELIDEDEFWHNYFYKVECIKAKLSLPNLLGPYIDAEARRKRKEQALKSVTKEPSSKASKVEIEMQAFGANDASIHQQDEI